MKVTPPRYTHTPDFTHGNISTIPEGSIQLRAGKHLHQTTGCFIRGGKRPIRRRAAPGDARYSTIGNQFTCSLCTGGERSR